VIAKLFGEYALMAALFLGAGSAQVVSPSCSGIALQYRDQPLAVLTALNFRQLQPWSIDLQNNYSTTITLTPQQILMATPTICPEAGAVGACGDVEWVENPLVLNLLAVAQRRSAAAKVEKYAGYAAIALAVFTGFKILKFHNPNTALNVTVFSSDAAVGLQLFQTQAAAAVPSLAPYTNNLLSGPVVLGPGQGSTVTEFAALLKTAHRVTACLP
jgi:hypothetical protein